MKLHTYAKINLYLDILGKRSDGYHDIRTVMQEISLHDIITVEKSNDITVLCNASHIPEQHDNIAYTAAALFFKHTNISGGAHIYIEKNIPSGAGLGGGSSNAAGVLRALNSVYNTNLSDQQLQCIASHIGADVTFFIAGGTSIAEGIGEQLTPVDWDFCAHNIIIIKPACSVSTKTVYENLKPEYFSYCSPVNELIASLKNPYELGKKLENILETVTISLHPEIDDIKRTLIENNAYGAMMSGSGSAVFGIFKDHSSAENAYKNIAKISDHNTFLCNFYRRTSKETI